MVTKDEYNLDFTIQRLKNSSMLPYNQAKIFEFYNEKIAQGIKKISYSYVLRILIELGEHFKDKQFEDLQKPKKSAYGPA